MCSNDRMAPADSVERAIQITVQSVTHSIDHRNSKRFLFSISLHIHTEVFCYPNVWRTHMENLTVQPHYYVEVQGMVLLLVILEYALLHYGLRAGHTNHNSLSSWLNVFNFFALHEPFVGWLRLTGMHRFWADWRYVLMCLNPYKRYLNPPITSPWAVKNEYQVFYVIRAMDDG